MRRKRLTTKAAGLLWFAVCCAAAFAAIFFTWTALTR
jgi:hypothetical protein